MRIYHMANHSVHQKAVTVFQVLGKKAKWKFYRFIESYHHQKCYAVLSQLSSDGFLSEEKLDDQLGKTGSRGMVKWAVCVLSVLYYKHLNWMKIVIQLPVSSRSLTYYVPTRNWRKYKTAWRPQVKTYRWIFACTAPSRQYDDPLQL